MKKEMKIEANASFHEQLESNGKWEKENDERYKEYRRKWEENPKNFVVEKAPIHLDIETSSICNLRCPMCFCTIDLEKGKQGKIKHGLMDMERYCKIIDEAARIGVYSVKLNWRGEPLMNPHIVEMVQYAKNKGIIDIMINTNGVNLNDKLSESLIEAGLDKIFFSVDSIDAEQYEKIRVGAKFNETINKIKRFCEINDEKGHPVYTRVQKVLLNETENENQEFIEFFSKIVDQIAFEDYIPYGKLKLGKMVDTKEKISFACSMLWQRVMITWDGEYMLCCPSGEESVAIGHNDKETIEEFWNGAKTQKIRELHKNGEYYKVDMCKNCYFPFM